MMIVFYLGSCPECDSLIESLAMCVRALHTEHNKQYRTEHQKTSSDPPTTYPNYQTQHIRTTKTQAYNFLTS